MKALRLIWSAAFMATLAQSAWADPFMLSDAFRCSPKSSSSNTFLGDSDRSSVKVNKISGGRLNADECWGSFIKDQSYDGYSASGNEWNDGKGDDQADKPYAPPSGISTDDKGFYIASDDTGLKAYEGVLFERVVKRDVDDNNLDRGDSFPSGVKLKVDAGSSGSWKLFGNALSEGGSLYGRALLITLKSSTRFGVWLLSDATLQMAYSSNVKNGKPGYAGKFSIPWTNHKGNPRGISHMSVYAATSSKPPGTGEVSLPASFALFAIGLLLMLSRQRFSSGPNS